MNTNDPFYTVKKDVEYDVKQLKNSFKKWKGWLSYGNTYALDIKNTAVEIIESISNLQQQVSELEETIRIAEKNPAQYQLTDEELASRKRFIAETKGKLQLIQNTISSTEAQRRLDERNAVLKSTYRDSTPAEAEIHNQMMQDMTSHQDHVLERVGKQVRTIGDLGKELNKELEEQNSILDDFNDDASEAHMRIVGANKYVNQLLDATKGNKSSITIVVLLVLLLLLVIIAFSI